MHLRLIRIAGLDRDEAEFLELAGNVTRGVPIATPVFDGATEVEIKDMLELAGLPRDARMQGRSWVPLLQRRPAIRNRLKVTACYLRRVTEASIGMVSWRLAPLI